MSSPGPVPNGNSFVNDTNSLGPILIERLKYLVESKPTVSQDAAKHALDYARKVGIPVADTLSLIERASNGDATLRAQYVSQLRPETMPERRQKLLQDLGADTMYYQTSADKIIQVATVYMYNNQYGEAQTALASSNANAATCRLAEHSAHVGIIQGNYNLVVSQEKRVDAFLATCMSNEMYLKKLTEPEVKSYWRVKLLILFTNFLKHNFEEVVKQAYAMVVADPITTVEGSEIRVLDMLNNSDMHKFIHKDEILTAVIISILITSDAKQLNDIHTEPNFIALMGPLVPEFRPLFSSLNSAKFAEFFQDLEGLDSLCTANFLFNRVWSDVKLGFRKKAYVLYLSLVKRVTLEHLSTKLAIPEVELRRELNELIRRDRLDFSFTEDGLILEATKPDKKLQHYERLNKLAEETDTIEGNMRTAMQSNELPYRSQSSSPENAEPKTYDAESLDARLAKYGR